MNIIIVLLVMLLWPVSQSQAGELINKQIPHWINVDLQLRHRFEYRSNFDFNDQVDDKDGFHLWRSRVGLTLQPTEELKFFYQFQDARISHDNTPGLKAVSENWAETRQLWVEARTDRLALEAISLSRVGLRLGRQELVYGAQRLLGAFDWSNQAQTFDAGKVMLEFAPQKLNIDVFAGGKTPVMTPREQDGFYDGAANEQIGGYYAEYKGIEGLTMEQYTMSRHTDGKTVSFGQVGDGEIEDYTVGARVLGKIKNTAFDFEVEAAKQFGNSGRLDVDAQMVVAILGYTFEHAWKPRVAFEFDYASGDHNRTDGHRETFDNLQPTNHLFYGYMDFVSLQNINNYRFQIKADPVKKLNLQADLHVIFLDSVKDQLYGANRLVKRATVAGADSYVGNEVDLLAKYQVTKEVATMIGYSHFFAGQFLKDTGSSDDADFFYIQTTLNY